MNNNLLKPFTWVLFVCFWVLPSHASAKATIGSSTFSFSESFDDKPQLFKTNGEVVVKQTLEDSFKISATISQKSLDVTQFNTNTFFQIQIGEFEFSGMLADDPKYRRDKNSAKIQLQQKLGSTGKLKLFTYLDATLSWSSSSLKLSIYGTPEIDGVFYGIQPIAANEFVDLNTSSIHGNVTATVQFAGVNATFNVPYSGKVNTKYPIKHIGTSDLKTTNSSVSISGEAKSTNEVQYTLFSNATDPLLLQAVASGNQTVSFFGSRDTNGVPINLTAIEVTSVSNTVNTFYFDTQSRPIRVQFHNGVVYNISWQTASNAILTAESSNGLYQITVPLNLPNGGFVMNNIKAKVASFEGIPILSAPSASNLGLEVIQVGRCSSPVDDATVVVETSIGNFPAKLIGDGVYGAYIPTYNPTVTTATEQLCDNAVDLLDSFCNSDGGNMDIIAEASCTGIASTLLLLGQPEFGLPLLADCPEWPDKSQLICNGIIPGLQQSSFCENVALVDRGLQSQPLTLHIVVTEGSEADGTYTNAPATGPFPSISVALNPGSDPIAISPAAPAVAVGQSVLLTANSSCGASNIVWSSNNTSVATVDPNTGIAFGLSAGTTPIQAITPSGKITIVTLTVTQTIDHIKITPAAPSVLVNRTVQLTATAYDIYGNVVPVSTANFAWQSTDNSIATVDQSGLVTGVSAENVTVAVSETSSGKGTNVTVTVQTSLAGHWVGYWSWDGGNQVGNGTLDITHDDGTTVYGYTTDDYNGFTFQMYGTRDGNNLVLQDGSLPEGGQMLLGVVNGNVFSGINSWYGQATITGAPPGPFQFTESN